MNGLPRNKWEHLRELVYLKNKWDDPLSEQEKKQGFLGWHERGYLPHYDRSGLVQLVTFRLEDSMPKSRLDEWKHLFTLEDDRGKRSKLEEYLDKGIGNCWLRNPQVAELVQQAMLYHHGKRYELLSWCIMPNHVHVLVQVWELPLAKILQNWKSISALQANRTLGRNGNFWQREYWDTFMRNKEQEQSAVRYIENNPIKTKLCESPEKWAHSSARFRDEYHRLKITVIDEEKHRPARVAR